MLTIASHDSEAEEQVKRQPHSYHKWFPTKNRAQLFIDEYYMTGDDSAWGIEEEDEISSVCEMMQRLTLD